MSWLTSYGNSSIVFIDNFFTDMQAQTASLSMDDFGTGYSSLSYLKDFSFNTIKIDRSFVNDLSFDSTNLAIINAINSLGKDLDMQIVAEGVETEQLKNLLETLHCKYMQGYFFSKPLTATEATDLLARSHLSRFY